LGIFLKLFTTSPEKIGVVDKSTETQGKYGIPNFWHFLHNFYLFATLK